MVARSPLYRCRNATVLSRQSQYCSLTGTVLKMSRNLNICSQVKVRSALCCDMCNHTVRLRSSAILGQPTGYPAEVFRARFSAAPLIPSYSPLSSSSLQQFKRHCIWFLLSLHIDSIVPGVLLVSSLPWIGIDCHAHSQVT